MPNAGATVSLLTSPEVAIRIRRSPRTVHRLVTAGVLKPAQKLPGPNGAFLFDPQDVEQLAAARATEHLPA